MTNRSQTFVQDGETTGLAGSTVSPLGPPLLGKPVILIQRAFPPPPLGSEVAITSEEGFESLGVIAVRLLAEWNLPRMQMTPLGSGEDQTPAATDTLNVGEDRSGSDW